MKSTHNPSPRNVRLLNGASVPALAIGSVVLGLPVTPDTAYPVVCAARETTTGAFLQGFYGAGGLILGTVTNTTPSVAAGATYLVNCTYKAS